MRIGYDAAALGLAAVLLAGCGGSGSAPTTQVPETSSSPAAALPQRGGLVGAVDSARIVAVCSNVRVYDTAVEGGLSAAADEAFDAIIQSLRQAPKDDQLLVLAAKWQLLRNRKGDSATAQYLLEFCDAASR